MGYNNGDDVPAKGKKGRVLVLDLTVAEIKKKLQAADEAEFAVLERSLVADMRKGVRSAVEVARRRLEAARAEREAAARQAKADKAAAKAEERRAKAARKKQE